MSQKADLGIEKKVVATEVIKLPRTTVQGLCEAIQIAFQGNNKPSRILYTKGEGLIVERMIPQSEADEASEFVTPWEMIRQHAEVEVQESQETALRAICVAASKLADQGFAASMLVTSSKDEVHSWFGNNGRVDKVLRIPIIEDPDCPEKCVVICGSNTGEMVQHIEYAVICRM
jgi:hypothetical protein